MTALHCNVLHAFECSTEKRGEMSQRKEQIDGTHGHMIKRTEFTTKTVHHPTPNTHIITPTPTQQSHTQSHTHTQGYTVGLFFQ